ncbi:MAG: hypothetical protein E4G92_00935 [Bacteroidia bacterium]|nr:MAG: hypothetical protein E4G92_00935 [Bacteroidia bacterium]
MKTSVLIMSAAFVLSISACGQTAKDVPAGVATAFSQKFPKASKVEWGRENDKEWEAEFKIDGKEYSANFDNEGTWMETEYEISAREVPAAVKSTLDKEFTGFKIEVSEISETSDGKVYEFVLEKGETSIEAAIDPDGKVLSREEMKEENEKDEK